MARKLAVVAPVLALVACASTSDSTGAGELTERSTYPAAPYGVTVGTTIENLTFGNPDGTPFTLFDDVFADPHNRVLFIATTAGWCSSCIEEQGTLRAMYKELNGKGLTMLSAYFEDADFNPATGAQAAAWKDRYKLPFPVLTQTPFDLANYYDRRNTPLSMVIDVDTMEILLLMTGFDEQMIRSTIEANLDL
jgi:peroxiredoxin